MTASIVVQRHVSTMYDCVPHTLDTSSLSHSILHFLCADNRQCWLHFINKGPVFVDNDLVVEFEGTGPNAFVQVSQFVCTLDNLGDTTPPVPIGLPNCKLSLLYSMLFFMHATKCVLYTCIPVRTYNFYYTYARYT